MKRAILISILMALVFNLSAQNTIDIVLAEVEKNNTTLSAFRKSTDAQKVGNKTGIFLQNPEIEFNYLWGNPSVIGSRTDFSIKQSFDFPTSYSYKMQISDLKTEQANLEFQKQRKDIRLQATIICVDLTYLNALKVELNKRLNNAAQIANSYKSKFNIGEISVLNFNKAQVNLLNISKDVESNEIERNVLLSELAKLNGGFVINFSDSLFVQPTIISDFEQWFAQAEKDNPILQWIKQEIAVSQKQKQLNTALSLPKFNAGYMSEKVVGQQFQGVSVGVSIPLWENKNTVKYAEAKAIAIQSMETDTKLRFYNQMKSLHSKSVNVLSSLTDYRRKMEVYNNVDLLQKALNKGEISLSEFMIEQTIYYESINKILMMEQIINKTLAELNMYK